MADRHVAHLLIGGGIASAMAAATLRDEGAEGEILLLARELEPPYHRPPATKGYLQGRTAKTRTHVHRDKWWTAHDVELRTRTPATALDPVARTATLATKEVVSYDTALLATGSMVRRLAVEGAQLDGVHYVRALANADAIRRDVEERGVEHVVCVGGSYIGCEVASSLTALGLRCTVLMQEEQPMERGFGPTAGAWVRRLLESHGVVVRGGVEVEAFAGAGEVVERVVLAGGEEIRADLVVAGVGALPDVLLATKAGLEIGPLGGVACDDRLRASAPGLWTAGDMCEYDSPLHGRAIRVEHEAVAAAQGMHAARGMLGADAPYVEVPYFWSDLADWTTLEHVGAARDWAAEELVGEPGSGTFGVRYLAEDGRLVAALSVARGLDLDAARAELRAGAGVV